jgi:hypothetical protein
MVTKRGEGVQDGFLVVRTSASVLDIRPDRLDQIAEHLLETLWPLLSVWNRYPNLGIWSLVDSVSDR